MASGTGRVGDLEITQDHDFQWLNWKLQRYLWAGMVALIGLALLGLFGSGPLSQATVGATGGPLQLRYPRFARSHTTGVLEIDLGPGRGSEPEVQFELSQAYLDGVQIEQIEPSPERVVAGPEGATFVFLRNASGRPTRIRVHLRPEQRGFLEGRIGREGGPSLRFRQWIYP